jgi:Ca-activated chloride channel family protein
MSFASPLLLLSLVAVPAAVVLYLLAQRRSRRYALHFTNLEVLKATAADRRSWRRHLPAALVLLALAALCAGVARPNVHVRKIDERASVILVVDTSRSMQERDVRPSRLEAAKEAARVFVERIPKRLRVGLVTFAGDVQVGAPPSRDHDLVRRAIDYIVTRQGFSGGTAIGDAIARAVEVGQTTIARSPTATPANVKGLVSILFLSDGRQNRGILQPLAGAARAKAAGIPVYTVALGTRRAERPTGVDDFSRPFRNPDPATLRAISRATGGRFFEARSAEAVKAAYRDLGSRLGRVAGRDEVTYAFLIGAAAVLLAAGVLSARWTVRFP